MIKISNDNVLIYQLLEFTGNLFDEFTKDKVLIFDVEDDCCLVLFTAITRNFRLFKAENYLQQADSLPSLIDAIQECNDEEISHPLINEAIRLIENKLNSDNARFYFDAH